MNIHRDLNVRHVSQLKDRIALRHCPNPQKRQVCNLVNLQHVGFEAICRCYLALSRWLEGKRPVNPPCL
jgi:hypothetical protein